MLLCHSNSCWHLPTSETAQASSTRSPANGPQSTTYICKITTTKKASSSDSCSKFIRERDRNSILMNGKLFKANNVSLILDMLLLSSPVPFFLGRYTLVWDDVFSSGILQQGELLIVSSSGAHKVGFTVTQVQTKVPLCKSFCLSRCRLSL